MALTNKQLADICCLNGGHKQCRYLDFEQDKDSNGNYIYVHLCKKLSPDKKVIDEEVDEFLQDASKTGTDPNNQGVALGDNCGGYIPLKTVKQGYDV